MQYPEKDKASCQRLFRRKAFRLLKFPHQESWNTWCRMHRSTRYALSSGVGNRWGLHAWKTVTGGLLTNDIPLTVPHTTLNSPVSADTSERTDLKHGSRTKAQRTSASENAPDRRQTNTHTHTHESVVLSWATAVDCCLRVVVDAHALCVWLATRSWTELATTSDSNLYTISQSDGLRFRACL